MTLQNDSLNSLVLLLSNVLDVLRLATPLFATFNAQRVIITCMLCCGIFNILIPHGSTPFMVASFAFFNGCFFGVQEIGTFFIRRLRSVFIIALVTCPTMYS